MNTADEERIFSEALALPAEKRAEYLDQACTGNAALRAAVEALLAVHGRESKFLESPPAELLATVGESSLGDAGPLPDASGTMIGPYKLMERIGEGGMGEVYMAEQLHPVRRRVALKLIKPGMDSRQVIARFEAERQALAIMDHPNIAKVLDASATDSGRPYFVMELVRGIPITEYCDQASLSTSERLKLFVQVCSAVQHAHTKGIIHRDLKPSNVLVTLHDGTPVPKIIDFGIAKATHGQRLTDKTLFTEFHQFVGTPQYMSPEQADIGGLDIDTRSDVYSLGVLLYELLTGTTPFDPQELRRRAYEEIQRIIREEQPPKPSMRLSTLGETLAVVAARRGTDPKKLDRLIRGELDWIVMRCLEKDRSRRYETASGLANDVHRHLRDEPVHARPPSTAYRLAKFARKHKVGMGAAAAVLATLLVGMIVTSAALVRAKRAQIRSQNAETLANQRKTAAEQSRDEAKMAQLRAEHEAARAKAARDFITQMLGSGGATGEFNDARIIDVLENTAASIGQSLRDQPETEFDVRISLGIAYRSMGLWRESKDNFARACDLSRQTFGPDSRETLDAAQNLIYVLGTTGEADEAESLARRSVEAARRKLGEQDAVTMRLQERLALVLTNRGKYADAEAVYRGLISDADRRGMTLAETTTLRHNFALLLYQEGKLQEAEGIARELFERWKDSSLIVGPVNTGRARRVFAMILGQEDKLAQARAVLFEVLDFQRRRLGDTHPDTLATINGCAQLLERTGEYAQALALHRELLAVARAKGRDDFWEYTQKLYKTGLLLSAMGEDQEAARAWSEAVVRVRGRDATELAWQLQWWRSPVIRLGAGGERQWRSPALRAQFWCAMDEHFLDNPGTIHLALDAVVWDRLRFRLDRWPSSVAAEHEAPELIPVAQGGLSDLKAIPDPPPGVYKHNGSFKLWLQLGPGSGTPTTLPVKVLYSVVNPPEKGFLAADRLLESLNRAVERSPQDADTWQARGAFYATHGRFAEAAADYRKAVQLDPANHLLWRQSAMVCLELGDVEGYRRDCREMLQRFGGSPDRDVCEHIARLCALMPDAVPNLKQVGEIADRAVALGGPPEGSDQRAWYELAKGMVEYRMGNFDAAADWLEKALKVKGWRPRRDEVASFFLAMAQYQRGQREEARQTLRQAIGFVEQDEGHDSLFAEWIAALQARTQAEALIGRISPTTVPATQTAQG